MNLPPGNDQKDSISNKIKVPIIILTIVTAAAFALFIGKLTKNVVSRTKDNNSSLELLIVGDKLRDAGLAEQAIHQYVRFLEKDEADRPTRARVAHTVGELYLQLGNCREGLVWLYRAEAAGPEPKSSDALNRQIDSCLAKINSGPFKKQ